MINLLAREVKENISYSRRNTILLKWLVGIFVGVVGIVIIILAGNVYLNKAQTDANNLVSSTQVQLKDEKLDQVQSQLSAINGNLTLMLKVLSKEVLYSELLKQLGTVLPSGAVLTGLNITQGSTGLDVEAATTNYQTATQVQVNLQDPNNQIFSKADIVSIQCQDKSTFNPGSFDYAYPCKAAFRAQFVANNPYLFIHSKTPTTSGTTK